GDELRDLTELLVACGILTHENAADLMRLGGLPRWRLHDGNQHAAFFQNIPRTLLRFAADGIEHHVGVLHDVFKTRGAVFNDPVDAEAAHETGIGARGGSDDVSAFPFCELHGETAHASG